MIGIQIINEKNEIVKSITAEELSQFPLDKIKNHYVAKVKPGKHSMILPLGAKADITIDISDLKLNNSHSIKLLDISGIEWIKKID